MSWSRLIVLIAATFSSAAVARGGVHMMNSERCLGLLSSWNTENTHEATMGSTNQEQPLESEWPSALSNSTASIILEIWSRTATPLDDEQHEQAPRPPAVLTEPEYDQSIVLTSEELKRAASRQKRGKGYKARRSRLMRESLRKLTNERELERRKRGRPSRCTNADIRWPPSLSSTQSSSSSYTPTSAATKGASGFVAAADIPPRCVELDLYDQGLTDAHARSLAAAFVARTNDNLRWMDLTKNDLGPDAGASLGAALPFAPKLTFLNLNSNRLGPVGAAALAKGLSFGDEGAPTEGSPARTLARIASANNDNNSAPSRSSSSSGAQVVNTFNSRLEVLVLNNNAIGDIGAAAIAQALATRRVDRSISLKSLFLRNNDIGDDGVSDLANALTAQHIHPRTSSRDAIIGGDGGGAGIAGGLETLDLSSNRIGDKGAVKLGGALGHSLSLDELHLSGQTSRSAHYTGSSSSSSPLLQLPQSPSNRHHQTSHLSEPTKELLDEGNLSMLGDAGALALANGLEANPRLSTLFLTNNRVGEAGAGALLECLETTALSALGLDRNSGGITESQRELVKRLTAF